MATAATSGPKTMADSWAAPSKALAASRSSGATILGGKASAAGRGEGLAHAVQGGQDGQMGERARQGHGSGGHRAGQVGGDQHPLRIQAVDGKSGERSEDGGRRRPAQGQQRDLARAGMEPVGGEPPEGDQRRPAADAVDCFAGEEQGEGAGPEQMHRRLRLAVALSTAPGISASVRRRCSRLTYHEDGSIWAGIEGSSASVRANDGTRETPGRAGRHVDRRDHVGHGHGVVGRDLCDR